MSDVRVPWSEVVRIETGTSSHIEPPCDDSWPERVKLAWWAAATAYDTGLRIEVRDAEVSHGGKKLTGLYHITVGGSSAVPFTFREAWAYLNGVSTGASQSAKPVPLDVSRDPQQHPRDDDGRYTNEGKEA